METDSTKSIGDLIKIRSPEKIEKSKRAQTIKEMYSLYDSPSQTRLRKIENWKRYCKWRRNLHLKDTKENQRKFQKDKSFVRWISVDKFCVFISHIKGEDLYYLLSVCKDKYNREQSIGAYITSLIIQ